ncbi:chemotaxis protein CheD [Salinibius halmophilus]|uniref:chemotaxis protein CheD n=1 Tax=Salinibius halmophilus TaxID=1853216 RepID=UPI000E663E29|nr:chemotaxis protein CheD [Salinibius halmophilus]
MRTQADVVLHPGDLYFGRSPDVAYTLLGSCVAVTVWHPSTKFGGMCHYLLAHRQPQPNVRSLPPGYFANDAFKFFDHKIKQYQLPIEELQFKMFGGGNMFNQSLSSSINVAVANVNCGKQLIEQRGWQLVSSSVGGSRYRKLFFDLDSGDVWLSYGNQEAS